MAPPRPAAEPTQLSLFDPVESAPRDTSPAALPSALASPLPPLSSSPVPSHLATPGHAFKVNDALTPPPVVPSATPSPVDDALLRHPRAQRETQLQGLRVAYEFKRARRRSIGFMVSSEGLSVSAPRWVSMTEVEAALREKAAWILRKLQEQRERARRLDQARVDWRDGTTIPFLGESVIVILDPRVSGAVLQEATETLPGVPRWTLHVGLPQGVRPDQLREAVQSWLQRQARRIFEERCACFAQRLGVQVRRLSLSSANTRWGSASANGSIRLNWRLVHFAMPVIDYVVVHELAHLRVMDHSPRFWDVVESVVPDYRQRRDQLKDDTVPQFA